MKTRERAIAGARRIRAAMHAARDPVRDAMAWLLLAVALASAGLVRAGSFDWRTRGVLFRVVPSEPAVEMPVVEAPVVEASVAEASGAEAPVAGSGSPAETLDAMQAGDDDAAPGLELAFPPSYLFATIHYGKPDELGLYLHGLRHRVREARVLINEVDGNAPWQPEYEPYRSLPEGVSLRHLLGSSTFEQLLAQLPGHDPAALEAIKPWVAMSMLEAVATPTEQSIDLQLQQWAEESRVRIEHLENLHQQLAALDCVPAQEYAVVLGERLRSGWSFQQEAERTAEYYRDRDLPAWLDEIDRLPGLDASAVPVEQRARHCLIEARNARWLPMLEKALRQGDAFVAVGAIHLTGEQGLLSQLSKRGFTVTVEPW